MDVLKHGILPKNFSVNEKYNVLLFIKQGSATETYRVKGNNGKLYFLKLFNRAKLHRTAFNSECNLYEIEFLKNIQHPNLVDYIDSDELIYEGKKYVFLVLNFIIGETVADRISRETISTIYDIKQIIIGILNGLNYLHTLPEPIIHNEITPQNIMLDLSGDIPQPKIIDFGYARSFRESSKFFNKEGLNLNYVASECFNNLYSPQSDLFSVGALMYHLLFGIPPWFKDISKYQAEHIKMEEIVLEERKKPLVFPNIESEMVDFDESILKIIKKALHQDPDNRFQSASEFIMTLNGEIELEDSIINQTEVKTKSSEKKRFSPESKVTGFQAIAGMQGLKDKLYNDVIDLLNDKEGAEKYGLTIPNGMLLYGPPGCGKTFFAEKFAEEAGFNYKYIRSSDLASIYVHGSQEKIGKLFSDARANAPMILCFDEIDALVPKRDTVNNASQSGEVNEFLSQLDNCGEDGIFVIGTTNNPESIDIAILRAGRMDIKVYVSTPDFESRKALFELYIKDKPYDFGIDYDRLSSLTENYVVSDLVLIVKETAAAVRKSRARITMDNLEETIKRIKPSVSISELKKHEAIKEKIENSNTIKVIGRNPVGFKKH